MNEALKSEFLILSERYAIALFDIAEKGNILDEFRNELRSIEEVLNENPELVKFLEHPAIDKNDKKDVVQQVFGGKISDTAINTLKLILDNNRIKAFSSIIRSYTEILNKKRNITVAEVITAIQIDEETIEKLKNKLQEKLGQNVIIDAKIDERIIAGMVVKIQDKEIDGSIRTKLENMKKQFA